MLAPSPPARSPLGSWLASRYELRALLGRGGMGEAYEAVDHHLNRTVAVKILRAELASERRLPARFRREARTVAGLDHPGIVAVYDFGQDGELTFIVMELVAGRTFADLIASEAPMDAGRTARIGMSAAQALAHAHSRGVVHRDVAPGNLMVTASDQVKVLDFGIARAARGSALSGSGTARGTVAYVAPEQLRGQTPDHRGDIYALGAVLYELSTGRAPFRGETAEEVAERARTEIPIAPSLLADVGVALSDVIVRCLAKDPADRFPDAGELAEQLWRAALSAPQVARPFAPSVSTAQTAPVPRLQTRPLPRPASRDHRHVPKHVATSILPVSADRPARRSRIGRMVAFVAVAAMAIGAAMVVAPSIASRNSAVDTTVTGPGPVPVPTELTALASCDGFLATGVDLRWSSGGPADGYRIWRRGGSTAQPELVATISDAGATSFRDIDLGVDTTYRYRVRAFEGPLESRASREAAVATPLLCLS